MGDRAAVPEVGVTASGDVAVQPAERVEAGFAPAEPGPAALERFAWLKEGPAVEGGTWGPGLALNVFVTALSEKWPALERHERAAEWLEIGLDLGRAPRTIDAYARGLGEFLLACEWDGIDPEGPTAVMWPRL
ncbi:hypothetical protein JBE27_38930 [Streptomyces albiflaviniger]|nr:hypothetical protein [Streptomyces albiflaviniger]